MNVGLYTRHIRKVKILLNTHISAYMLAGIFTTSKFKTNGNNILSNLTKEKNLSDHPFASPLIILEQNIKNN